MKKAQRLLEILNSPYDDHDDGDNYDDENEVTATKHLPIKNIIFQLQKIFNRFAEHDSHIAESSREEDLELYDAPSRSDLSRLLRSLNSLQNLRVLNIIFETSDSRGKYQSGILQVEENHLGLSFIINERASLKSWVAAYEDNWRGLLRSIHLEIEDYFREEQIPRSAFHTSKRSKAARQRHRRERREREGPRKGEYPKKSVFRNVGMHPELAKWKSHRKRGLFQ